jgi:site-specific recombinase XerD
MNLLLSGVDLTVIAMWLGHESMLGPTPNSWTQS